LLSRYVVTFSLVICCAMQSYRGTFHMQLSFEDGPDRRLPRTLRFVRDSWIFRNSSVTSGVPRLHFFVPLGSMHYVNMSSRSLGIVCCIGMKQSAIYSRIFKSRGAGDIGYNNICISYLFVFVKQQTNVERSLSTTSGLVARSGGIMSITVQVVVLL